MTPTNIDAVLLSIMTQRGPNLAREVEMKRVQWCSTVASLSPGTNGDLIRTTFNLIMASAQRLGQQSALDPVKLYPFFLRSALNWIADGKATVQNVVDRMPRTVEEVGLMAVAENIHPMTGKPLTAADLKAAQKGGKLKLQ